MKFLPIAALTALAAAAAISGTAGAQAPAAVPPQTFYYENTPWPLPDDGATTALRLSGMKSVHIVWMTFNRYDGGKPVTDSPVITLMEGSTVKWTAPGGGCSYELQLVNADPPLINMKKPTSMCSRSAEKVIFKVLAMP